MYGAKSQRLTHYIEISKILDIDLKRDIKIKMIKRKEAKWKASNSM